MALRALHYIRGKQLRAAWQEKGRHFVKSFTVMQDSPGKISNDRKAETNVEDGDLTDASGASSKDKQFEASIKVAPAFMRFIAGKKFSRKQSIEEETKTQLYIPARKELRTNSSVVVKGPSQAAVEAAVRRIQNVIQRIERIRTRQASHFVSLPLVFPEIIQRVYTFQKSVLAAERDVNNYVSWFPETPEKPQSSPGEHKDKHQASQPDSGLYIDPDLEGLLTEEGESSGEESDTEATFTSGRRVSASIFTRPSKFHVPFSMMRVRTEDQLQAAVQVLEEVKVKVLEILDGRPVKVRLRGLEVLRGTPTDARVLCIRVQEDEEGDRLVRACQAITDAYVAARLTSDLERKVKLFAVVMNVAYRQRGGLGSFDARRILLKHAREDSGEYPVPGVHLSERFVYDDNGYFHCHGSIPFPSTSS